ncbi:MAG: MarR family winged helix-turn-helix transcriptional regulator [Lautropia sp.]
MPASTAPKHRTVARVPATDPAAPPVGAPDAEPGTARDRELRAAIEAFFFGYRAFTARPDRILASRGLGRVHHRILYFVGRDPGRPVSALLTVLGVSKQALNAPLRHLVASGLVVVRPSPADGRVRLLHLSAEGRRLEQRLTGTQMLHLARAFAGAPPHAEAAWRALMRQIALDEPSS